MKNKGYATVHLYLRLNTAQLNSKVDVLSTDLFRHIRYKDHRLEDDSGSGKEEKR